MVEVAGLQTNKLPRMVSLQVKFIFFPPFYSYSKAQITCGITMPGIFTTDSVKQSNCSI